MRLIVGLMALVSFGCATQSPVDKPAAAKAVPTPTAPVSATAVKSAGSAASGTEAPDGYHLVDRNGVKYYCTDAPALGTRIKSRVTCMTAEQFELAQTEAKDKMRERQGRRVEGE